MTPAKLAQIALTLLALVSFLPKATQAQSMGSYHLTILDQFNNTHFGEVEFYIEEEGNIAQGFKGKTQDGEAYGLFPVGSATFKVGDQTRDVVFDPEVTLTVVFKITVTLPGPDWPQLHYRGQGVDGEQIFGVYADRKIFNPRRWEVKIFEDGKQIAYPGVLTTSKDNAHVMTLSPGEHTLRFEVKHYLLEGAAFSFDKVVEVDAPAEFDFQSTFISRESKSVAFWLPDGRFPEGSTCKFTVRNTGFTNEGGCPRTADEAVNLVLTGEKQIVRVDLWHTEEQVSATFDVEIKNHILVLPLLSAQ